MRIVGVRAFGGPGALRVEEVPDPHAGPGEVRIAVRAAAVNPVDTLIRAGASPVRPTPDRPAVPGLDLAGVVDEIGAGAGFALGERVMAMVDPTRREGGAYAEFVVLPESWVVPVPAAIDLAAASTLPMNALTALHALEVLALPERATVAVSGAAGAVGGYAVQWAKVAGHRVIADAAEADGAWVRSLGADVLVPRGFPAGAPAGEMVDGVVDAAVLGTRLLPVVRPGGAFASVRDPGEAFAHAAARRGVRPETAFVHVYDGRRDLLDLVRRTAERGALTPRVAAVLPFTDAPEAHRRLAAGGTRGRLVLAW